jgi:hypothetical protein
LHLISVETFGGILVETPGPDLQEAVRLEAVVARAADLSGSAPRRKSWSKWLWLAGVAFLIFQIYYVREMLAVLVLFAGLFVVVALIAGVVYALGRAGESTITAAEPVARRSFELAEEVSRKTFRRPRSAPAP